MTIIRRMNMEKLTIDIYSDGADLDQMKEVFELGQVTGFTTNPSLMKKAGIDDYNRFAQRAIEAFPDVPISFEVFADDFDTMQKEAEKIATFGDNVFVKIPVMNTKGESSLPLIKTLSEQGIKLNVTAIFTVDQVKDVVDALQPGIDNIVSVFAGRIADTGVDPMDIMKESAAICHEKAGVKLLWASTRELLNLFQAQESGSDIITVPPSIIQKLDGVGKDLLVCSRETVQGFADDIAELSYTIL